jgi:hypothetical protein
MWLVDLIPCALDVLFDGSLEVTLTGSCRAAMICYEWTNGKDYHILSTLQAAKMYNGTGVYLSAFCRCCMFFSRSCMFLLQ